MVRALQSHHAESTFMSKIVLVVHSDNFSLYMSNSVTTKYYIKARMSLLLLYRHSCIKCKRSKLGPLHH